MLDKADVGTVFGNIVNNKTGENKLTQFIWNLVIVQADGEVWLEEIK